jgi:hypothetical protein
MRALRGLSDEEYGRGMPEDFFQLCVGSDVLSGMWCGRRWTLQRDRYQTVRYLRSLSSKVSTASTLPPYTR